MTTAQMSRQTTSAAVDCKGPRHLLSAAQLGADDIQALSQRADALRQMSREELSKILQGAVVATLFYEPSTRTRMSFEAAVLRLGGHVVTAENALENSSAKKGERLEDVFRVVGSYVDAIVIRHHEATSMVEAAPWSPVPIVNAGAGAGEHPTQALLDVYTILREVGRVDGLNITLMGDLRYGRTIHSLLRLLALYDDVHVTLLHPVSLGLPTALHQELTNAGLCMVSTDDVDAALASADVVYQTRIQKERLANSTEQQGAERFYLTTASLQKMKAHTRILHPLPRIMEIHPDVDTDERAAYFRQAENGLYIRMAILEHLVKGDLA